MYCKHYASSPSPGSSVRVRVKSKSLKKIRVESTTHTSQVRAESLLIHIESESSPLLIRVESTTHTSH